MNLQDLLQGVLSGKFAVPQGALSTPYSDAANVRDLSRQNIAMTGQQPPVMSSGPMSGVLQPAYPGGPPLGPGLPPQGPPQGALAPSAGPGRDPGMNGALAPTGGPGIPQSAQVGGPPPVGYGRAPDSIGSGRPPMGPGWNPQLDPNQPQASPQPGNGVLALDNATAMSRATPMGPNQPPAPPGPVDQGPTPMALQSTDESTPVPQAKPGALAGDPHTRAKGILAAAVSGNPQAIQQAVMDPQAASQAGSQVPDGPNWNPGSAYDTADAPLPPKNAADAQKQADAAHDQDKQQTFGQKALGVLSNPDTGLLLQSIGVGLLTSRNPWQGIGQGVQMYQQLHLKNQDRQLEAKRVAVEEKRATSQEKYQDASLGQGQERIGLEKGDQEIRRTDAENIARYRAQQLQQSGNELAERSRHDRADEGNTAAATRATLARLQMDMDQPTSTQVLPTTDGMGAKLLRTYRNRPPEIVDLPDGVAAGLSLVSPAAREDAKNETGLVAKGTDALHSLDETSRIDQLLAQDPNGIGPGYKQGVARWAATKLGLGDSGDPLLEMRALKAQGAIAVESALHNVRGSNLVLNTVKDAVNNIETMTPAVIKAANEARKQDAVADLQASNAFLDRRPDRATSSTWSDYVSRRDRMNTQGGARSGVDTSGKSVGGGAIQTTPEEDALITKHLK